MVIYEGMDPQGRYSFKDITGMSESKLKIDILSCIECGFCVDACPNEAVVLVETTDTNPYWGEASALRFEANNCDLNGACAEICPLSAIVLEEEECSIDDKIEALVDDSGSDDSDTYTATTITVSDDIMYREVRYAWTFYKHFFWLWYFVSEEVGIHRKAQSNGNWQWDSLTHSTAYMIGATLGGSLTLNMISATPTTGIANAAMALHYTITANVVCKGAPGTAPLGPFDSGCLFVAS